MGQPYFYHAPGALSVQIEIYNLNRTKYSSLATGLYKKVIFTKKLSYKVSSTHQRHVHVQGVKQEVNPVRVSIP